MEERLSNIEFRQNGLHLVKRFDRISHCTMNNRRNRIGSSILITLTDELYYKWELWESQVL